MNMNVFIATNCWFAVDHCIGMGMIAQTEKNEAGRKTTGCFGVPPHISRLLAREPSFMRLKYRE